MSGLQTSQTVTKLEFSPTSPVGFVLIQTSTVWFYKTDLVHIKPVDSCTEQPGPVYLRSDLEVGLSVFPPLRFEFEEEVEKHENQTGADIKDHTKTHVNAVKTQTQNPNTSFWTTSILFHNLVSSLRSWLLLKFQIHLFIIFLLLLLKWVKLRRLRRRFRRTYRVFGGQVGGSIVLSQEHKYIVPIPDMDTIFLLMTRGTEGGARP